MFAQRADPIQNGINLEEHQADIAPPFHRSSKAFSKEVASAPIKRYKP
jgi:hypothetical protein